MLDRTVSRSPSHQTVEACGSIAAGKWTGGGVGPVEDDRSFAQRRVEVALVGGGKETDVGVGIDRLRARIEPILSRRGRNDHQRCRFACDRRILSHHDRDGLAVMEDRIRRHAGHRAAVRLARGHARIAVEHRDDAGQRFGGVGIDPRQRARSDRRANDRGIGDAIRRAFEGIVRDPRHLARALDPRQWLAQYTLLAMIQRGRPERGIHHHLVHAALLSE